jgi:hypothetical protein
VITVCPAFIATASPEALMVALEGMLLDHWNSDAAGIRMVPSLSMSVAVNC